MLTCFSLWTCPCGGQMIGAVGKAKSQLKARATSEKVTNTVIARSRLRPTDFSKCSLLKHKFYSI